MPAATRHAVGWSGLKAVPVCAGALTDDKNRIVRWICIVDALTAEFARGVIEAADFPDGMLRSEAVQGREQRNRKQSRADYPAKSVTKFGHVYHFGWVVMFPGRLGSSVQAPISWRLESS